MLVEVSNFFFSKIKKNFIKFVKFFSMCFFGWVLIVPNFASLNIIIGFFVSMVSALFLTAFVEVTFYKHITNFLGFFKKIDFYKYIFLMYKEVFFSVCNVIKNGLDFSTPYYPRVIEINLPEGTPFQKILLVAISIILTPGTTIIGIDGLKLTIHCLTREIYQSIEEQKFVNKILSYKL